MTNRMASEDLADGSEGYAERRFEDRELAAARHSIWRVSLGGVLIFAAGAMVGFAPMRAWFFFREPAEYVTISAIVVEADAKDVADLQKALSAHADDDLTRNLDPATILQSRSKIDVVARFVMQTKAGEPATYASGQELYVHKADQEVQTRFVGLRATFETNRRPAGDADVRYRISSSPSPLISETKESDGETLRVTKLPEESVESNVTLRPDVWEVVPLSEPFPGAPRNVGRWIFLKVDPDD